MRINKLKLTNFRSFSAKNIEFGEKINILNGINASGKTTCLESIYLMSLLKSYKTSKTFELINNKSEVANVYGEFYTDDSKKYCVSMGISGSIKETYLNNKKIDKMIEYIGTINSVMFSTTDFLLINGSPSDKRKMFDAALSQMSPSYLKNLISYKQIIKQKNTVIKSYLLSKKDSDLELIKTYSNQSIQYAKQIINERIYFLKLINDYASKIHFEITGEKENLKIEYIKSFKSEDYEKELEKNLKLEIQNGCSIIGPHRDDFLFYVNELDAAKFASQGQQRNTVLSIKLAIAEIIAMIKNEKPIVLLDDVFSELDSSRQNGLIKYLDKGFQIIITTATISDISEELLNKANIINIC